MKTTVKTVFLTILMTFIFVGCANKNKAYKEFEKSPCACFEDYKKVKNNV